MKTVRECPACGQSNAYPITQIVLKTPDGHPLQGGFTVVSCKLCGTGFANVEPPLEFYEDYYATSAKYATEEVTECASAIARAAADRIASLIPGGRVLDIGAGAGTLVRELQGRGYDAWADDGPDTFDLISLTGVLEHVWDIESMMRRLSAQLEHDGWLYIEVPDAERYLDPYLAPTEFNTEHINHFSASSLATLMRRYGFRGTVASDVIETTPGHNTAILRGSFGRFASPLTAYANAIIRHRSRISAHLEGALWSHGEFALWGAGEFAFQLLASAALANRELVSIVDSNPARHNLTICGRKVAEPSALLESDCPVIIASAVHSERMIELAKQLGIDHRLVTLDHV